MSCQQHQQKLSDYIDGLLSAPEEAELRVHLDECSSCRVICRDLILIREACRDLPEYEPSPRVWERISAAIAAESFGAIPSERTNVGVRAFSGGISYRPYLAMAAGLLAAVLVGVVFFSRSYREGASRMAQGPIVRWEAQQMGIEPMGLILAHTPTIAAETVEQHIRELEQEIARKRPTWGPDVERLFEKNVAIIDRCIDRCRRAAQQNPSDPIVRELYLAAIQAKLEMLKQFVAL